MKPLGSYKVTYLSHVYTVGLSPMVSVSSGYTVGSSPVISVSSGYTVTLVRVEMPSLEFFEKFSTVSFLRMD